MRVSFPKNSVVIYFFYRGSFADPHDLYFLWIFTDFSAFFPQNFRKFAAMGLN